jgi:prolyl-tRNA synthetase
MFDKAHEHMKKNIVELEDWEEFLKAVDKKKIIYAPFCEEEECEDWIKDKTKGANSRCIPFGQKEVDKKCVHCGKEAKKYAYFGKCY